MLSGKRTRAGTASSRKPTDPTRRTTPTQTRAILQRRCRITNRLHPVGLSNSALVLTSKRRFPPRFQGRKASLLAAQRDLVLFPRLAPGRHTGGATPLPTTERGAMGAFMRDTDAFTWYMERDPILRSTVVAIAWLDRSPDWDVLVARLERATRLVPMLRHRVLEPPGRHRHSALDGRRPVRPHLAPSPDGLPRRPTPTTRSSTSLRNAAMTAFDRSLPSLGVHPGGAPRWRTCGAGHEAAPFTHGRHRRHATRNAAVRRRSHAGRAATGGRRSVGRAVRKCRTDPFEPRSRRRTGPGAGALRRRGRPACCAPPVIRSQACPRSSRRRARSAARWRRCETRSHRS